MKVETSLPMPLVWLYTRQLRYGERNISQGLPQISLAVFQSGKTFSGERDA